MEAQQAHIVQTATRLFGTYGVKAMTMDDIAGRCGISKKTLYHFFENKYELLQLVIAGINVTISQAMNDIRLSSKNAVEEVYHSLPVILKTYRAISYRMIMELEKSHYELWRKVNTFRQQCIRDFILCNLSRGRREGLYNDSFNPEIIASMRLQQLILLHSHAGYNTPSSELDTVLFELTTHYLSGLATAKGHAQIRKATRIHNQHP